MEDAHNEGDLAHIPDIPTFADLPVFQAGIMQIPNKNLKEKKTVSTFSFDDGGGGGEVQAQQGDTIPQAFEFNGVQRHPPLRNHLPSFFDFEQVIEQSNESHFGQPEEPIVYEEFSPDEPCMSIGDFSSLKSCISTSRSSDSLYYEKPFLPKKYTKEIVLFSQGKSNDAEPYLPSFRSLTVRIGSIFAAPKARILSKPYVIRSPSAQLLPDQEICNQKICYRNQSPPNFITHSFEPDEFLNENAVTPSPTFGQANDFTCGKYQNVNISELDYTQLDIPQFQPNIPLPPCKLPNMTLGLPLPPLPPSSPMKRMDTAFNSPNILPFPPEPHQELPFPPSPCQNTSNTGIFSHDSNSSIPLPPALSKGELPPAPIVFPPPPLNIKVPSNFTDYQTVQGSTPPQSPLHNAPAVNLSLPNDF